RRMARYAERRLLVHVGNAVPNASAPRRVGMPGISGAHDVIDRGLYGRMRIPVRRRIIDAGAQFIVGMIGLHSHVVGALVSQDARKKLVTGQGLYLMRQR